METATLNKLFEKERHQNHTLQSLFSNAYYRCSFAEALILLINCKKFLYPDVYHAITDGPMLSLNWLARRYDVHPKCRFYPDGSCSFRQLHFVKYESNCKMESPSLLNFSSPLQSVEITPYTWQSSTQAGKHVAKLLRFSPCTNILPVLPKLTVEDQLATTGLDGLSYITTPINECEYNILIACFSLDELSSLSSRRQTYELSLVRIYPFYVAFMLPQLPNFVSVKEKFIIINSENSTTVYDSSLANHLVLSQRCNIYGVNDDQNASPYEVLRHA